MIRTNRSIANGNRRASRPLLERLEGRELLASMIALTTDNHLLRFDTSSPDKILRDSVITGVAAGDTLQSLAIRPQTGQLFGLGNQSRFYGISTRSASATQVGPQIAPLLSGSSGDFVINPATDTAELITNSGQNFTINPANGASTLGPALPTTLRVAGIAYTNNNPGASSSQLFGIDYVSDNLVSLPDPASGTVTGTPTIVGPLGVNILSPEIGFAIAPDGTAYAAMRTSTGFGLYTVDLTTGAASPLKPIGDGTREIMSIAVERPATAYGISTTGALVSFNTDNPAAIATLAAGVSGLAAGEAIASLSFDPASGDLFGIGTTGAEYRVNINPTTGTVGAATLVGTGTSVGGSAVGAFDPITDEIRVVTATGQTLQYATNGAVTPGGKAAYAFGDINGLFTPQIAGIAADNPLNGAGSTTIYGVDSQRDTLVTIGSTADDSGNYTVDPDTGQVFTVGTLGVVVADPDHVAFAINTKNDSFAVLTTNLNGIAAPRLYRLNLATGQAAYAGDMGGGMQLTTMTLAQPGVIRFGAISPVSEPAVGAGPAQATITITRSFGDTSNTADVVFSTAAGGTAVAGTNFQATSKTLSFGVGEYSKTVTVPILNDGVATAPLTANLQLSRLPGSLSRLGGTLTGGKATASLTINNTGGTTVTPPPVTHPGVLALSAAALTTVDSSGTATVVVTRTSGLDGSVSVIYTIGGGSATAGVDYAGASGTLTFDAGVASRSIVIPVRVNPTSTGPKTFLVTLTSPTGGATLGSIASETVTILPAVTSAGRGSVKGATAGSVVVGFGATPDAAAAVRASSYVVTVGGKTVKVASVAYNPANGTVTLKLARKVSTKLAIHVHIKGTSEGGAIPGGSIDRTIGATSTRKKGR